MAAPLGFELRDRVALITISRPEVHNAFTTVMWNQLVEYLEQVRRDRRIRVVVIHGGKDFSAGSDLKELSSLTIDEVNASLDGMEQAISHVEVLPVPVIAAMSGYALGGGFELALACDLRVADRTTVVGMPLTKLGIMISPRFARRVVDLCGPGKAKTLLLTGRLLPATEAHLWGFLDFLVDPGTALAQAMEIAKTIAVSSPAATRAAKLVIKAIADLGTPANGREAYFVDPHDFPRGVQAFLEKRPPDFDD